MNLSIGECEYLLDSPEALGVLIRYNDQQETYADGFNDEDAAEYHKQRASMFRRLRIEAETRRAVESQET